MYRTHLALALFLGLLFLPYVREQIFFLPIVLLCALLPDIDCMHSRLGRYWFFRPIQWFIKHRGMLHSLTFCVVVALLISFAFPVIAFPFFLGYASHLFGDAITEEGIRPWWPLKKEIKGFFRTGKRIEKGIFVGLIIVSVFLAIHFFWY
ncbi:MAG: metal-dependent hydrolase [Nanoarchaeota archaeon]